MFFIFIIYELTAGLMIAAGDRGFSAIKGYAPESEIIAQQLIPAKSDGDRISILSMINASDSERAGYVAVLFLDVQSRREAVWIGYKAVRFLLPAGSNELERSKAA